jgi:enoyl-CoA hydratase
MGELVTTTRDTGVATVTLDDGKVNALSLDMLAAINRALDEIVAEPAVTLIAGREGTFSAGFDLRVLTAGGPDAIAMLRTGFELAERLLAFPAPVVVACTGHALAMGSFLLLSADYRVGADGAFKIGANEVAIGLTMPQTAVEICRHRLNPSHFNRAVVTAEIFSPTEAVAAGFLDRVGPPADVLPSATAAAQRLGTLNMTAHVQTKLRAREDVLKRVRAAIEADDAAMRALA